MNANINHPDDRKNIQRTSKRRKTHEKKTQLSPFLEEYNNRIVVKIAEKNLRYYDRSKGFFKTAKLISSDEAGYKYYLVANTEDFEPNKYYELDIKPTDSTNVACWKQDVATTKYYENTHYFLTSIKKDENIVELLAPKKGDVSLVLSGNAFYSGATLDKVILLVLRRKKKSADKSA